MTSRPYHHGDLRSALLRAAEAILERDGIGALTLRAAARAAGVSHAAPANHFGDLAGLLSELAAVGYQRLADSLARAGSGAGGLGAGAAYVAFARAYPGLFALMFRSERLDFTRPALRMAADAAFESLRRAVACQPAGATAMSPLEAAAQAAARWALVHGFATLLLDGRLNGLLASLPPGEDADSLLMAVLTTTRFG